MVPSIIAMTSLRGEEVVMEKSARDHFLLMVITLCASLRGEEVHYRSESIDHVTAIPKRHSFSTTMNA